MLLMVAGEEVRFELTQIGKENVTFAAEQTTSS